MDEPSIVTVDVPPRAYLYSLMMHGIKLGLENIQLLLDAAGHPETRYPTVHVSGTNGKGSVVAFLGAMLRESGYRVGTFTSPHLIDLEERFQINGQPATPARVDELIQYFQRAAGQPPRPPTFFELNTAMAFRFFELENVEIALIEVGMGGRFDSTNVIVPRACAVTSVDLEHTQFLGDSLEKIAFEKAGIIKPGVPVVIGETKPGPRAVLVARAAECASSAQLIGEAFDFRLSGTPLQPLFEYASGSLHIGPLPLPLIGPYQGANAAIAVRLAEMLQPEFTRLDADVLARGLSAARWPCRLERVLDAPPVIVDATHTPAGARYLRDVFDACTVVLSLASDKDARGILEAIAPLARHLILTEFEGKRAMPVEQLAAAAHGMAYETAPSIEAAIAKGVRLASDASPLLVTGSVFAAGETRRILCQQFGAPPLRF